MRQARPQTSSAAAVKTGLPPRLVMLFAFAALILLMALRPAFAEVKVEEVVSPGGIKAWLVRDETVPVTAIEFSFKGGGAGHDKPGKEGTARLTAGTIDEGAGPYDSKAFQGMLSDKSITVSFSAGTDTFSGSFYTLNRYRDEAVNLLSLALTEPRFDDEPVERVRSQILIGLKQSQTDPDTIASKAMAETIFKDHPYGRPDEGTLTSVPKITVADMKSYMAEALTLDKLKIGVVGAITPKELGPMLDKIFGKLPKTGAPDKIPAFTNKTPGGTAVIDMDVPQSTILFAQPGLSIDDPRYYTGMVMNYVLGGGSFSSVLTDEIRVKRGLAYSVYSYLQPMDHAALLRGGAGTQNARVGETIDLVKVFSDFKKNGLNADMVADAKTYITGSFPLRFTNSSRIASQLESMQYYGFSIDYFETRNSLIEAVTLDDVNALAKDLLDPDALTFVVVGKPKDVEATLPTPGG
ncbi:MAG: pitrilysin family protein [Alphaproteobacteria bacterium]|nr:pitrilysin family protein [Alphaproteobacteria bacterium]